MFEAGKIYLGAKRPIEEICGTLIHELCHFAMQLIYDNQCNPFPLATTNKLSGKSFSAKASAFQPITYKANERQENMHEIIKRAFTEYDPKDHDAELIVRVPHLIAQFGGKGLEILKQQVPELLDYYENVALQDLLLHLKQQKLNYFQIDVDGKSFSDILFASEKNEKINFVSREDSPMFSINSTKQSDYGRIFHATTPINKQIQSEVNQELQMLSLQEHPNLASLKN